jgi:DNA repair photolyase
MPLKTLTGEHGAAHKGRGATINPEGRFEKVSREAFDDGWDAEPESEPGRPKTIVTAERVKSIISKNDSPDIPFTLSINPYRVCSTITIGANTDPYQPVEREWKVTRSLLEVVSECNQPIGIITKNALVERDLDILAPMAEKGLVSVYISVTTLDHDLARKMEPRASAPARRLEAIRRVAEAGVPVGVMVAPIVPFLTDSATEQILEAAHDAGALSAGYVLMRLPYEVKDLFRDWLMHHYPLKADHVMSRVKQMRGGRENDPAFGTRMRGSGEFAELLRVRFEKACKRLGLNEHQRVRDVAQFRPPRLDGQMDMFQGRQFRA